MKQWFMHELVSKEMNENLNNNFILLKFSSSKYFFTLGILKTEDRLFGRLIQNKFSYFLNLR